MKLTYYDDKRQKWELETRVHICWWCGGTAKEKDKPSLACRHCYKGMALDEGCWKELEPEEVESLKAVIRQRRALYMLLGTWNLPKSIGGLIIP